MNQLLKYLQSRCLIVKHLQLECNSGCSLSDDAEVPLTETLKHTAVTLAAAGGEVMSNLPESVAVCVSWSESPPAPSWTVLWVSIRMFSGINMLQNWLKIPWTLRHGSFQKVKLNMQWKTMWTILWKMLQTSRTMFRWWLPVIGWRRWVGLDKPWWGLKQFVESVSTISQSR